MDIMYDTDDTLVIMRKSNAQIWSSTKRNEVCQFMCIYQSGIF